MKNMSDRLSKLSEKRKALFNSLLEKNKRNTHQIPERISDESIHMSHAQQRLWFIDELDPGNPAYTCPVPLKLKGTLIKEALINSLKTVINRHEVLRTTYDMKNGTPIQIIHDDIPLDFKEYDFSHLSSTEQKEAINQTISDDATTPFNLRKGPIMRSLLIRLSKEEHILIVDIHHIANDHASIGILFNEISTIYNKYLGIENQILSELPIQYADYSLWQHNRLESNVGSTLSNFWRDKLEDFREVDLPTDYPRPATLSHRGAQKYFKLNKELVTELQKIAKQERASLYMVMLAAFKLVLARYTDQDDISIGCSITGRDRPELQNLIGFFINTIILRTKFDNDPSFRELLRQVRTNSLEAYAHSEYPFNSLVQSLKPQRSTDRNPMVSVMFMLDETPSEVPKFSGLEGTWLDPSFITTKFDILFSARPSEDGVYGHIQYSTDLFKEDTIERLITHFKNVLEKIVDNPDLCISQFSLLSEKEKQEILIDWNNTHAKLPYNTTLHETIEHRIKEQSDFSAIISKTQSLSYGDLNKYSENLTSHINNVCASAKEVIAISIERSAEFVIAILAVLKSGHAYVPLDPEHHTETHIMNTMKQVGARILISQRKNKSNILNNHLIKKIYIDDFSYTVSKETIKNTQLNNENQNQTDFDDIAYIICSSGSTGKPKAIAIKHQGVLNNILDINQRFSVNNEDRILFLSSTGFDMSVYETIGILVAGGALIIPDSKRSKEPKHWLELLVEEDITIWNSAPALLELLVEELEIKDDTFLPNLRLILLGGDWIPVSLPDRIRKYAPNVQVVSFGGATEASIHSTIYSIDKVEKDWKSIPYGKPLSNQRVYVLDRWMQPTPIGVPGELYIGGVGLSSGYIGLPKLTKERFIDLNVLEDKKELLFKTGDSVRWRNDGNLELIGRIDFQDKIHGLRVDLSDIEAAMNSISYIKDTVVMINNDNNQTPSLIAYYVSIPGKEVSTLDLRKYLTNTLPIYMIPSYFIQIESVPKNKNGKVNRLALKALTTNINRKIIQKPTNKLEESLLNSWKQVLNNNDIGIDDDFFEVGGDSFSAIRLSRSIKGGLPVVELFKHRTVRMLAYYLENSQSSQSEMLYRLTTKSKQSNISLICIPYGGGNVSVYQSLADKLPAHIDLWSVALPGHDPGRHNEEFMTWENIAEKCCLEIIEKINGPIIIYGQCAGSSIAIYLAHLLENNGYDINRVYVGAALPDVDPIGTQNLTDSTSENELEKYIQLIGGFDGALDYGDTKEIVSSVRHDMLEHARFFEKYYQKQSFKLRTSIHCLLGEDDIITNKQEERFSDWNHFSPNVKKSKIIRGNHYFVKNESKQLANLLANDNPL